MGKGEPFDDWIQARLAQSDVVLYFMSRHSTRRPDSVCLDEIAYARSVNLPVVPVLIEDATPPFLVSRINWLDARDAIDAVNGLVIEARYQGKLKAILASLQNGIQDDDVSGTAIDLKKKLSPQDPSSSPSRSRSRSRASLRSSASTKTTSTPSSRSSRPSSSSTTTGLSFTTSPSATG